MRSSYEKREETSLAFGGQAVIEGVMIRSRKHMVICLRRPNGEILTKTEDINSFSERHRVLRMPFTRGAIAIMETLYLGIKGLLFSANVALEEEGKKFTYKEIALTLAMTLALSSLFIVLPFLLTTLLNLTGLMFNIVEAVVRLTIFLIYLALVSLWSEFKGVLRYHGAEHKAINTYEAGIDLNVANAKKFSRFHPRCGTSFIFVVMFVSILLFSIMPNMSFLAKLSYRVLLTPVIGVLSYEILKFSDRHRDSKIMKILVTPGLSLQCLTTREPDEDMLEVALKAIKEMNELRNASS